MRCAQQTSKSSDSQGITEFKVSKRNCLHPTGGFPCWVLTDQGERACGGIEFINGEGAGELPSGNDKLTARIHSKAPGLFLSLYAGSLCDFPAL